MSGERSTNETALRRELSEILASEDAFVRLLAAVRKLGLPDAWVAAGALRNLVWDRLHGFSHRHPPGDVDVVYFDPVDPSPEADAVLERRLREDIPDLPWEVVNQAWIHEYNDEAPYASTVDSLSRWTETCTSVAARLDPVGGVEILAPHGVGDLLSLVARPNIAFANAVEVFTQRMADKRWPERWPRVEVLGLDQAWSGRPGATGLSGRNVESSA